MKKVLLVLTAALAVLLVSCDDSGGSDAEGSTVTVKLTGDGGDVGADIMIGLFVKDADPEGDYLAMGTGTVPANDEVVTITLVAAGTTTVWTADSNTSYDIYIFVDADIDGGPTDGDEVHPDYFPKTYNAINSSLIIEIDQADMTAFIPG